MKKLFSFLIVMIAMFMVASAVGAKEHSNSGKKDKFNDPEKVEWAIKKVRKATEKYHDVDNAVKDGYVPTDHYVQQMGYHYMKDIKEIDGVVDPLAPEALLYMPTKKGLQLIGVEYVSTEDQSLFGEDFDDPGALPWYTLHAWIWTPNPKGMFEAFNPAIPVEEPVIE